jgi:hypothetical protein
MRRYFESLRPTDVSSLGSPWSVPCTGGSRAISLAQVLLVDGPSVGATTGHRKHRSYLQRFTLSGPSYCVPPVLSEAISKPTARPGISRRRGNPNWGRPMRPVHGGLGVFCQRDGSQFQSDFPHPPNPQLVSARISLSGTNRPLVRGSCIEARFRRTSLSNLSIQPRGQHEMANRFPGLLSRAVVVSKSVNKRS